MNSINETRNVNLLNKLATLTPGTPEYDALINQMAQGMDIPEVIKDAAAGKPVNSIEFVSALNSSLAVLQQNMVALNSRQGMITE